MQGEKLEKEKPDTLSKVTVKNKNHDVKPREISERVKRKGDNKGKQASSSQPQSVNNPRQALLSGTRGAKTTMTNHVIEMQRATGKGQGISEKHHAGNSSTFSKTTAQSVGTKDRGLTSRKVSTVKESNSMSNKKPIGKSSPSSKALVIGKSGSLHHNKMVDKKDENVKFKGGGLSIASKNNLSSKVAHRSNDALNPSIREAKDSNKTSDIRSIASVICAKKRAELVENDKKQNSPIHAPKLKGYENEKSGSRMKENLKKIMSAHVRKSKMEHSSQPKTSMADRSVSCKPSKNVVDIKESSSKKGRERTRTWTINSYTENNNLDYCGVDSQSMVSESSVKNCGVKPTSMLENLEQRGKGNESSAEWKVEMIQTSTVGAVENSFESKTSSVTIGQSGSDSSDKSSRGEQSALVKENVESQNVNYSSDVVEEYDYEDDFEDYESDFEEYTDDDDDNQEETSEVSSDQSENSDSESDGSHGRGRENASEGGSVKGAKNECAKGECASTLKEDEDGERKMDSGLYDSGRRRCLEEDFSPWKLSKADADEGFDEREEGGRVLEEKSPRGKANKPLSFFINCEVFSTKREPLEKEVAKKVLDRGRKLLQMITLDEISYSLFELPPIPYDAFMKCRGHRNTKQISTQTNEDCHSEGIQTDSILMVDVWTQRPPMIGLSLKESMGSFPHLLDNSSWIRLGRFMESAGEVMAILLEEQWNNFGAVKQGENSLNSPLSKISVKLGHSGSSDSSWQSILASRPVTCVCFCKTRSNLLLCCHGPPVSTLGNTWIQSAECNGNGIVLRSQSSLLSVWSVSEPSYPQRLLCCQGYVTQTCFQEGIDDYRQLLVAGCEDGSICVWDMDVKGGSYVDVTFLNSRIEKAHCPMFTTHGDETHLGRIVGLEPVLNSEFGNGDAGKTGSNRVKIANQVCSLDEWGVVVVWSVIWRRNSKKVGRVNLVASRKVFLSETNWTCDVSHHDDFEGFQCERLSDGVHDVALWNALAVDSDWILAASDTGSVVCLPVDGEERSIKVYPGPKDSFASAESIAVNPQGLPFFMVGNFVGQAHLYSHTSTRHFGSWEPPSSSLPSAVVKIAWSPQRPFVFFTVDSLSRIHIWDLASSDIFPFATLPSPKFGRITDISLSFPKGNSPAYMAVGMDNGEVVLHHLKDELTTRGSDASQKELSHFIKYANLL